MKKVNSVCLILIAITLLIPVVTYCQVDTAWVRRWSGSPIAPSSLDRAYAIAVDATGNVYVTGQSYGLGTNADYATIKYKPNGDTAWVRIYNGPGNSSDIANAIAVDATGNVYVTGYSTGAGSVLDYATIKYNANGSAAWVKRYDNTSNDYADAIAVDASGNVYVSGYSFGSGTGFDYATIKYNPNGDTLWVRRYNGPGNVDDQARSIKVDGTGNVYVTGFSNGSGTAGDYATIKYNPNGDTLWVRRYNGPGNVNDEARSIVVDGSGNVYVTGFSIVSGTNEDYATIKYNASGDTMWVRRYNGPGNVNDQAYAIAVDDAGNSYVTGYSFGSGTSFDYATIKYNPNGDTLWLRRYNGPGNGSDQAYALALDTLGNAYITGHSVGSGTSDDYATLKYNPNGSLLWFIRYNGPINGIDVANSIAVNDSGNVYVTGYSASNTMDDFATIKYIQRQYDVGVTKIEAPSGTIDSGTVVAPACSVYNYGNTIQSYLVRMKIGSFYNEDTLVANHTPGTYRYYTFPSWTAIQTGAHTVSCSTELNGDMDKTNDKRTGSVTVNSLVGPSGWVTMAPIPPGLSTKKPKAGSCMAGVRDNIFFLKASNTQDFCIYTPDTGIGTWTTDTMPLGTIPDDGKKPKKGASMTAYNQTRSVYVLRGTNRVGFWRYQVDTIGTEPAGWYKLKSIPMGLKAPKDASGMATFRISGDPFIFTMKGSKTDEFYTYSIEGDTWHKITSPPPGTSTKIGYKKGSCLTEGGDFMYVLKGNYGDFFKYNIDEDTWIELKRYDAKLFISREGKKKKPKDGASLVYNAGFVYMLKGGNTREVWKYDTSANNWSQMDLTWDIPLGSGKKVKGGGGMIEYNDYFWAAKGGNTDEFYRHELPITKDETSPMITRLAIQADEIAAKEFELTIVPNPAINVTAISYKLPNAGPVIIKLYNVAGSLVKSYVNSASTKNGTLLIDAKELVSGVYILRFESGMTKETRKLVLEK